MRFRRALPLMSSKKKKKKDDLKMFVFQKYSRTYFFFFVAYPACKERRRLSQSITVYAWFIIPNNMKELQKRAEPTTLQMFPSNWVYQDNRAYRKLVIASNKSCLSTLKSVDVIKIIIFMESYRTTAHSEIGLIFAEYNDSLTFGKAVIEVTP